MMKINQFVVLDSDWVISLTDKSVSKPILILWKGWTVGCDGMRVQYGMHHVDMVMIINK